MIVDIRTYTLVPRKLARYVELFEELALPVMAAHHLQLVGYYTSVVGPLNQVVHLWRYADFAEYERKRTRRDADPGWARFQAATDGLVLTQENKLMRPLPFSPDYEQEIVHDFPHRHRLTPR